MHLSDLFTATKPVIGMLHVPPLPGSPRNTLGLNAIVEQVLRDPEALAAGGIDGMILENFGDFPFYPRQVPPHTVAFLTVLGREVRQRFGQPLGVNVLRNDSAAAIAIAAATDAQFIRVNVHTGARLTDQGIIEGMAHDTLRYRKLLGCDVKIFADVDAKHSAPIARRELSIEVEEILSRGCADAIVITGSTTGRQAAPEDLKTAKAAAGGAPVIAGSGVDARNFATVLEVADGLIVGTALKQGNITTNAVEPGRVRAFMQSVAAFRAAQK